jgi:succinyl-CoA synthetase beta subunit
MKIHEYQAKELLSQWGISVPRGEMANTPERAEQITSEMGGTAVVKAQVHAGGRGKAGGVKVVTSPEEALSFSTGILGTRLITHQTGAEGAPVNAVLVEEALSVDQELYLGVLVDASSHGMVVIASAMGGMDIEEVSSQNPEKVFKVTVDITSGFQPYQGRKLAYSMGLPNGLIRPFTDMLQKLCHLFTAKDLSMVEINPLGITSDGRLLALDAKLTIEDDALFRHKELQLLADPDQEDPLEVAAQRSDISYVRLDGDVGCMVNGAGLAMATMDIVLSSGAAPANFLDVGGGASQQKVAEAFKILLQDPKVERVLVNIFGGILRCDVAAQGILDASREIGLKVPVVTRMVGTNMEEGRRILRESGLNITLAETLAEAADRLRQ